MSNKNVARLDKEEDANNNNSILYNDFLAKGNPNTVRQAQDFINTNDTLIGNGNVPLSRYSQYQGVEDGKLIAGPIDIFNSETEVTPIRSKNIGKVTEILLNTDSNTSDKYPYSAVTVANDTVPLYAYQTVNDVAGPKIAFSDEEGNAIFASNLSDEKILEKVNKALAKTARYPIMTDNGRFRQTYPEGENLDTYAGFENYKNMFIIGTK